jgi:hypothetical protein
MIMIIICLIPDLKVYAHCAFGEIRLKKVFVVPSLLFSAASLRLTTLRILRGKWAKKVPGLRWLLLPHPRGGGVIASVCKNKA